MKKIYALALALFFVATGLNAQSFELINVDANPDVTVTDNDIIINQTQAGTTAKHHFLMKNTSALTQTVAIRKTIVQINTVGPDDEAKAYFCTGTDCYDASVMNESVALAPNDTMTFTADLDEATVAGTSEVAYKFSAYNTSASTTLSINFTIKYNPSPVGISKQFNLLSGVSSVFPNPTTANAFVTIQSDKELNGVQVSVFNSLGARVSSKEMNLTAGKNTVDLGTEKLNSGIYFVKVRHGASVVTQKLTVLN